MLKLMKYELRKTAFSKLVLLVITAVAEIAFLIGVFWKKDNILAMGIIFLVMCTIFGVIYIGIESVNVLHRDLNTKQSYMLFLTPKSSYQILGAKILENGISIIMAGAFFAALAALDVTVATLYIGGLKEMINLVSSFMEVNWSVTFTLFSNGSSLIKDLTVGRLYKSCYHFHPGGLAASIGAKHGVYKAWLQL